MVWIETWRKKGGLDFGRRESRKKMRSERKTKSKYGHEVEQFPGTPFTKITYEEMGLSA